MINKKKSNKNLILIIVNIAILVFFATIFISMIIVSHKRGIDHSFAEDNVYDWSEDWSLSEGNSGQTNITLPYKASTENSNTVIIRKTLPNKIKKYNCIMLESNHQDVIINVGGVLRTSYSNKGNGNKGMLSPDAVLLVPIYSTDEGADISILFTKEKGAGNDIGRIYLGNEKSVLLKLIKDNVIWLGLTVVIFIISLVLITGYLTYGRNAQEGNLFAMMFWFALTSAIWCFSRLKIRQMFIHDLHFADDLGYMCYMLVPGIASFYSNLISRKRHAFWYVSGVVVCVLNFLIQLGLHMAGGVDFYSMIIYTQILIAVLAVTAIVFCAIDTADGHKDGIQFQIIGITAMLIVTVVELLNSIYSFSNDIGCILSIGSMTVMVTNVLYIFISINADRKRKMEAENANLAKSLFLATMSHEIRTPINAVLGMNEMILRESNEPVTREYSNNIAEAGKSLLSLVNDILDFSKIESGKMDIICVEYQMKSLLQDLILMIQGRIKKNGLNLILDIDESIPSKYYGDEVRIKQILTNLLTNAAKYTKEGSITFTVKKIDEEDGEAKLYFSVKDTGMGIRPQDIERLMSSSFIRVDEEKNRNIEGTGLGLSITRQLLSLMDSELSIDSEYEKGSDFHFVLKQKIVDASPMNSVMASGESVKKRKGGTFTAPDAKILAVDDTRANLMVLRGLMKTYQCVVATCDSGARCLDICKGNKFDIIFMDHMMPDMDGIETLQNLKEKGLINEDTKVVALTANAISGADEMYRSKGFDGYMTKPIDVTELDNCLKKFLPGSLVIDLE